ncbi:MAG: hypothetical protein MK052_09395 [Alphaproteobacteria bacterium]|nr:hypothetical protein [Alphaproteobacteria bacterium]
MEKKPPKKSKSHTLSKTEYGTKEKNYWEHCKELRLYQAFLLLRGITPCHDDAVDSEWENEIYLLTLDPDYRLLLDSLRQDKQHGEKWKGFDDHYAAYAKITRTLFDRHCNDCKLNEGKAVDSTEEINPRVEETLLKIVIGMAVKHYNYDPTAQKSEVAKKIESTLDVYGLNVTDETIRKYLKKAASILPAEIKQNFKK